MLAPPKIVRGKKEFLKPLSILQHPRGQDPHDQKLEMPKQQGYICVKEAFTDISTHIFKR